MKQNILGILAVVAAIGLSAFTAPKKPATSALNLYWYVVDRTANNIPQGSVHYAVGPDEENLCAEPSTENTQDCIRGFSSNMDAQFALAPSTSRGTEQKLTDRTPQ